VNARQLGGPVIAVLVGLAVYFAWPREKLSPEDEIRALVARMVASAERRDVSGVLEGVAEEFRGGGLTRAELKQLVLGQLFGAQQVVVLNPLLQVTVKSPTEGHFKGTFLLGRDGAAPEASRSEIEADVRKGPDGWRVVSGRWSH
jgi:hypothetical protein